MAASQSTFHVLTLPLPLLFYLPLLPFTFLLPQNPPFIIIFNYHRNFPNLNLIIIIIIIQFSKIVISSLLFSLPLLPPSFCSLSSHSNIKHAKKAASGNARSYFSFSSLSPLFPSFLPSFLLLHSLLFGIGFILTDTYNKMAK